MSYNKSLFQGVPKKHANKSRFNLSHEYKSQILPGTLVPILTMETMPGDEFDLNSEFMFRFSSLYFPIMHKMTMRADYFYVPNRILWIYQGEDNKGWTRWISEQEEYVHPTVDADMKYFPSQVNTNVLGYMGIPLTEDDGLNTEITELNALPLSAYVKIYDEYYRVPQLEDERWFPLQPGDNTSDFNTISFQGVSPGYFLALAAKWEKDYFTSALPTPQIGEQVLIPMLTEDVPKEQTFRDSTTGAPIVSEFVQTDASGKITADGTQPGYIDIQETAATIKQFRLAETLQSYYERIMKVGQRYRDFIEGLFGHDPQPMQVDVPVLIGSRFGRVQIADVMTQADTVATKAQVGDYRGQANLYSADNERMHYKCLEHGWLMCILQLNPNTSYGQGIERFWRRSIQTDYPLDMFSNIGDQEILKEEIFHTYKAAENLKNFDTFGYIPRHSEMRYKNNMHTMQLNFNEGLSQHLGRWWDPAAMGSGGMDTLEINAAFTESAPESIGGTRIVDTFRVLPIAPGVQSPSQAPVFIHVFHDIWVNRQLPMYATPSL